MNLQKKDIKILRCLLSDGRAKATAIARKTRLSREIVDYRIKKLEREEVIEKFSIVIDEAKLGYQMAHLFLNIRITSKEEETGVITSLVNSPSTIWAAKCGGKYNFVAELFAKNISSLEKEISKITSSMGDNLDAYKTFLATHQYKYTHGVGELIKELKGVGERTEISSSAEKITLTTTESKLLTILSTNGRDSLTSISKKLKLDPDTVSYHIRKLKNSGVLLGITPHFNLMNLGYQKYIVLFTLRDVDMTKDPLKRTLQSNNFVRYALRHFGVMQVYALMFAPSTEHFHDQLNQINLKHHKIIQSIESLPVFRKYKENLFPEGMKS